VDGESGSIPNEKHNQRIHIQNDIIRLLFERNKCHALCDSCVSVSTTLKIKVEKMLKIIQKKGKIILRADANNDKLLSFSFN
jgi:hypothetical protein